jgi:hypothetical protein
MKSVSLQLLPFRRWSSRPHILGKEAKKTGDKD